MSASSDPRPATDPPWVQEAAHVSATALVVALGVLVLVWLLLRKR